ncbi:DUF4011 domain-containing protein [Mesorhizobium sp. M1405]|uniref:DUF4011 domain-containing protein n=1 Tax=Mesorhizobium sp. M1405 TaxID=2957098 RepID=UPI003339FE87
MAHSSKNAIRKIPGQFAELVARKIEELRPRLLDLTPRNPLISMSFHARSTSHVRVVDELPEALYFRLTNGEKMVFSPLPPFDEDSKDEQTPSFVEAYTIAYRRDEAFTDSMAKLDPEDPGYVDDVRRLERELKDRLRSQLGMPIRITRKEESVVQHAKNNGISASYDLPAPQERHDDGRHEDDHIQTLLLPPDLERKLNGIISKARTVEQETGISVLRTAIGFLEWKDPARADGRTFLSPLILLPVKITLKRTPHGPVYWVEGTGDEADLNLALKEKLSREFAIELPDYDGGSVEDYFEVLGQTEHRKLPWRVRRQVVFGVFPAARMSMYADLDTSETDFAENDTLENILVGSDRPADGALAEEYEVDDRDVEASVRYVVKKADSSQFSVLVDLAKGKNLAVEGPPGTGKSDTIVNAIAAALGAGKRVLFVAEKSAALEVVKNRLDEVGLGEFILPLLAGRSSREEFMDSIRDRLDLRAQRPRELEQQLDRFSEARDSLSEYVEVLGAEWNHTGITVHELLGRAIATAKDLEPVPKEIILNHQLPETDFSGVKIADLATDASRLGTLFAEAKIAPSFWQTASGINPSPFAVDRILDQARLVAESFEDVAEEQGTLSPYKLAGYGTAEAHDELVEALSSLAEIIEIETAGDHSSLLCWKDIGALRSFLTACRKCQNTFGELAVILVEPAAPNTATVIESIYKICRDCGFDTLDADRLTRGQDTLHTAVATIARVEQAIQRFIRHCPESERWTLGDIVRSRNLASATSPTVLRLRSARLEDVAAVETLADLVRRGIALKQQKSELADILRVNQINGSAMSSALARIRSAGRLSFLAASYREAKRQYGAVSRRSKFDRIQALADLEKAVALAEKSDAFLERARNAGVFGVQFNGLETDFSLFAELVVFYEAVVAQFPRVEQRELRHFLKTAEPDVLSELPILPEISGDWSAGDVTKLHNTRKEESEDYSGGLNSLLPLLAALKNPSSIAVEKLPGLAKSVRKFCIDFDVLDNDKNMQSAMGKMFGGWRTPIDNVEPYVSASEIISSAGEMADGLRRACRQNRLSSLHHEVNKILDLFVVANGKLEELGETAEGDFAEAFRGKTPSEIVNVLKIAAEDRTGLRRHIEIASVSSSLDRAGVLTTVNRLNQSGTVAENLGATLQALINRASAERVYRYYGRGLHDYSGVRMDELRKTLKAADDEVRSLSRKALRAELIAESRPAPGISRGRVGDFTEMGLIEHLADKRRIRQPVREIMRKAARALLELKPCWIMSPLAVAQYIPKGTAEFDLCIIDEASQMPPEDAIGALFRARQAMVVGDTKQLPPTNFFRQVFDDQEEDDDADPVTDESVLEMANATFRPKRMLRWHYRSRNSALIRFSNRIMYDDNLVVFPSPNEEEDKSTGVSLMETNGIYKAGLNDIEAHKVVEHALALMRKHPERSLGIVAVNKSQAEHIRELLDYQIARDKTAFDYVEHWKGRDVGLNAFFVKNLENVQGDERDVIFISTVYGPPAAGKKPHQRFGPINGIGGQRRLNVLFSRARDQIVTFTSMTGADITADQTSNPGAWMLKRWLEYSAGAPLDVADSGTHDAFDSPLEDYVASQIRSIGCLVDCQVGVDGYSIDLAVRHPAWPYGYILGVECDGATYHSSRSARDRDRHRQEILENLGWHLYRVWSTDWFANPREEANKLRAAITERVKVLKEGLKKKSVSPTPASQKQMASPDDRKPTVARPDQRSDRQNSTAAQTTLPFEQSVATLEKPQTTHTATSRAGAQLGDTVRIRYMDKADEVFQFKIVTLPSAPERGLVNASAPLAKSVIGCEVDDEFEVLFGSRIRKAVVEKLEKGR